MNWTWIFPAALAAVLVIYCAALIVTFRNVAKSRRIRREIDEMERKFREAGHEISQPEDRH